jgi:hypothetical protein
MQKKSMLSAQTFNPGRVENETITANAVRDKIKSIFKPGKFSKVLKALPAVMKLSEAKELVLEKQAGIGSALAGGFVGSLGGTVAGGALGKYIANKKHPANEETRLVQDFINKTNKETSEKQHRFINFVRDIDEDEIKSQMGDVDQLTVGQLKKKIYDEYNKRWMVKTASLKHFGIGAGLGAATLGLLSGSNAYNNKVRENTDTGHNKDLAAKAIRVRDRVNTEIKKGTLPEGYHDLSPAYFTDVETDGMPGLYNSFDELLRQKHQGNVDKLKMVEYKKLMKEVSDREWNR